MTTDRYHNGRGKYQDAFDTLSAAVPVSGACDTVPMEVFRCLSNLYWDVHENQCRLLDGDTYKGQARFANAHAVGISQFLEDDPTHLTDAFRALRDARAECLDRGLSSLEFDLDFHTSLEHVMDAAVLYVKALISGEFKQHAAN